MKVKITLEWDDASRRALAIYLGDPGKKASREDIQGWMLGHISTIIEDLPDPGDPDSWPSWGRDDPSPERVKNVSIEI